MRRLLPGLAAGILGLNLWVVLVALPAFHVGSGASGWALGAMPLLPLCLGVLALLPLRRTPSVGAAGVLLVLAYPVACLVPLAVDRSLVGVNVYGPGNLVVGTIALLAYGAGAVAAVSRATAPSMPHRAAPIQGWSLPAAARRRRTVRLGLLAGAVLVAVSTWTAAFLRPDAGADLDAGYHAAAPGAAVAAGAIATLLPLGVMLVYFGPALRRPAPEESLPSPASRLRSTIGLVLLGAAAAVALVLLRLGR